MDNNDKYNNKNNKPLEPGDGFDPKLIFHILENEFFKISEITLQSD